MKITSYCQNFANGLKPDPNLTFWEWAGEYFLLPPGAAVKGLIQLDRIPYLKGVLEALSWNNPTRKVIVTKGTQLAMTTVSDIVIQATIDLFPCPILMVFGSDDMALEYVKTRIEPALEDNPKLKGKVKDALDRKGKSTKRFKDYKGGSFKAAGGFTGKSFRSFSAAIVIVDDVGALKQDVGGTKSRVGEGDPLALIGNRTDARQGKYKQYFSSTPIEKNSCLTTKRYLEGDQCHFMISCPQCGTRQEIDFFRIRYKDETGEEFPEPFLKCKNVKCDRKIYEHEKSSLMQAASELEDRGWVSTAESKEPYVRSFHAPSTLSDLGFSWVDMVREWKKASRAKKKGDLSLMVHFYTTRLGVAWESKKGTQIEHSSLYQARENYTLVPKDCALIFSGVDIQKNRIEITTVAYNEQGHRYFLEHDILFGDTWIEFGEDGSPWDKLETYSTKTFTNEFGHAQRIDAMAIDHGYNAENVAKFIAYVDLEVEFYAVFGKTYTDGGRAKTFLHQTVSKSKFDIPLRQLNVDIGKEIIANQLDNLVKNFKGDAEKPVYIHFNKSFTESYFEQLTAEVKTEKMVNGKVVFVWSKPAHVRNEALDTANYSFAAREIYGEHGIDWKDCVDFNKNGGFRAPTASTKIITQGERV